MPNLNSSQQQFISESWKNRWEGVLQAQSQVMNWLFALNTGGVAGALTYAASKETTLFIALALFAFSTGLLCMIGFAACMYYREEDAYISFRSDAEALYGDRITWGELIARDDKRPLKYKICEVFAWIAGISGGVGIVLGSIGAL